MMNFNPAMYWWQWMLDQMDEQGEGGEGFPRLGMRMGLSAQLAAMRSYRQMLEAAKKSGSLNQVYEATKKMIDEMWSAARQEQPSVIDAQLSAVDAMIQKLEEEQKRANTEQNKT
jgi:hypothetical protein